MYLGNLELAITENCVCCMIKHPWTVAPQFYEILQPTSLKFAD